MDGRIWMQMDADGFLWVRWGVGTRVHNKTRQSEAKISKQVMFPAPMTGGNFPKCHGFLRSGVEACKHIQMYNINFDGCSRMCEHGGAGK